MHAFGTSYGYGADWFLAAGLPVVLIVAAWSLFWKGLALWHAARHQSPRWFVVLLILNTLGILEIIYLFGVLKLKWKDLFVLTAPVKEQA